VNVGRITWHELLAVIGGGLLALGLFLPWYSAENELAVIAGQNGPGDFTAWEVHTILRWLLLAAAAAPLILAWIIARGHALSWPRGELTAVVAITALGLAGYNGLIDRPGEPSGLIGIKWGFFVSLLGILLMLVGSALRASEVERKRKPPGVL
jgi:hypothetical protein